MCRPSGSGAVFSPPGRPAPWPPAYALLREKARVSQSVVVRVRTYGCTVGVFGEKCSADYI